MTNAKIASQLRAHLRLRVLTSPFIARILVVCAFITAQIQAGSAFEKIAAPPKVSAYSDSQYWPNSLIPLEDGTAVFFSENDFDEALGHKKTGIVEFQIKGWLYKPGSKTFVQKKFDVELGTSVRFSGQKPLHEDSEDVASFCRRVQELLEHRKKTETRISFTSHGEFLELLRESPFDCFKIAKRDVAGHSHILKVIDGNFAPSSIVHLHGEKYLIIGGKLRSHERWAAIYDLAKNQFQFLKCVFPIYPNAVTKIGDEQLFIAGASSVKERIYHTVYVRQAYVFDVKHLRFKFLGDTDGRFNVVCSQLKSGEVLLLGKQPDPAEKDMDIYPLVPNGELIPVR
jgi:hypothetical protein